MVKDILCLCVARVRERLRGVSNTTPAMRAAEKIFDEFGMSKEHHAGAISAMAQIITAEFQSAGEVNRNLVDALRGLLRAFESDKEQVPDMDMLSCWECNSQAIARAHEALKNAGVETCKENYSPCR